jgi:uncharacterized phage protein gp47/JayE
MFDRLSAVQEEYVAKGWLPIRLNLNKGIVRGMIELWCWGLWQLYQFLALILKQAFADTATGLWLDLHCKAVGITRKAATKATGTVYFTRAGVAGNVPIPAGRVIRTEPDGTGTVYRYVTTEDAVLQVGSTEVAVAVEAEDYGTAANATAGQISVIVTTIQGVDGVENRAGWLTSEGSDEELDEPLRQRYVLAWQALSGCTKYAYQAWALSVPGVVAATILDQHPRGEGTVDVVIRGTAGLPTQTLIDAVDAVVVANRPINDDTVTKGPTAVPVTLTAQLSITGGDPVAIMAEAENRARALFGTVTVEGVIPFDTGDDGTIDRLKWPMMIEHVKKITVTSPVADVAVDIDEWVTLQALNLTYVIAEA